MATIYWRGKSAYINWTDTSGQHRISLGRVSALEAQAALQAKVHQLEPRQRLAAGVPSFAEFVADYLAWHAAEYPSSHARIRQLTEQQLVPAFGFVAVDQVRPALVNQWKMSRLQAPRLYRNGKEAGRKIKTESVNKELRTLKAILNKAVEWEVIAANPARVVKTARVLDSKPPEFYSVEQLRELYGAALSGRRWVWQLFANLGLRRAEGINLRRQHVYTDRVRVLSTDDARTKSGKWREIPANNATLEALDELPGKDWILPRMQPGSLSRLFAQDAHRAGVRGNLHMLRHTFCTHLVMAGTPLPTVQKLAGHSSITVTERYAHAAPGHLQNAMRGVDLR